MARIELRDVKVTYRLFDAGDRSFARSLLRGFVHGSGMTVSALDGINLTVEPGSRVAVLGSNSSGKTTLLRVAAGLVPPRSGTVRREGRPGAVFSMGFGVDPEAGLGDLAYAQALLMGLPPAEARTKVRPILEFADIGEHGTSKAQVAPPGILARLGIASVLCLGAEVILLDEVLEQVDPAFLDRVAGALDRHTQAGGILLAAERSRELLSRFCSEALLLRDGRLAARAPLAEVLSTSGASQTF
jgi:ABC-type polysaccharide/polyol phosphate transport system ATPase subunit